MKSNKIKSIKLTDIVENKFSFILFIFILFQCALSYSSTPNCSNIFILKNQIFASSEINDLNSFGQAMTEGMLLHPEQSDLFEVYRNIFFGDPKTGVDNQTLKSVTDILTKHPELKKPHFREYEISQVIKVYESPASLTKYLKSQFQTAGEIRNNLLQIEANLGFWKKILNYQDPELPAPLQLMQSKLNKDSLLSEKVSYRAAKSTFEIATKKRFETYLNKMISKKNRDLLADLKNENEDYQKKAKALFTTLKYIQEWMDKRGRNTQPIRQAMVDLVHTVGFANQATQVLLKSKNALDQIEGLKMILDERDSVAMDLGYDGHFQELQSQLKIDFPTGFSKNENPNENIQRLEPTVINGKFITKPSEKIRVRSLSIQEAPFRSCLGGSDCSTRTYFSKALDPNFIYFTMTDENNNSTGQVTVVLGEVRNLILPRMEKIAFIDKLQNIPNQKISIFLDAVSKSLAEKGYTLALPEDLGDHNGLSNMDTTRHFIANEILPKLTQTMSGFIPHPNPYHFENAFSRAYNNMKVKLYELTSDNSTTVISPGRVYQNFIAADNLNKNILIPDLIKLKNSQNMDDVLKYLSSGTLITKLDQMGLFSIKEFNQDMKNILERKDLPLNIRKQAAINLFLYPADLKKWFEAMELFTDSERSQLLADINQWSQTSNLEKKQFFEFAKKIHNKIIESQRDDTKDTGNSKNHSESIADFFHLFQNFLELKKLQNNDDILKYITNSNLAIYLEELNILERDEFNKNLNIIFESKNIPFNIRKEAFFEILIINENKINYEFQKWFNIMEQLTDSEKNQILAEINQWPKSSDYRKKKFASGIIEKWFNAVEKSDIKTLENFLTLNLIDINSIIIGDYSTLLIAIYKDKRTVVEWLIANPNLDLKRKNKLGFTDIEQARMLGKIEYADFIESKRPDSQSRKIQIKERNDDGSPIIDFVKIIPGKFKMNNLELDTINIQVDVLLTKNFELMSIPTTQKIWKNVIDLGSQFLDIKNILNDDPSGFKGSMNPVENVSHDDVVSWFDLVNKLSSTNNVQIQQILITLFPGHKKGDLYRLPTEAEWEYVARLNGLSTYEYLNNFTEKNLMDYAWFAENAEGKTHPVGLKKPIINNGKPIYDIYGNVLEWVADWTDNLRGGVDPVGPTQGSTFIYRGGCFSNNLKYLRSGFRNWAIPDYRYRSVGFRIARTSH